MPEKVYKYLKNHALDPRYVKDHLGWNWNDTSISIPVYDASGIKLYDKIRHLDHEEKLLADIKSAKFTYDPPGSHPALYCFHKIKSIKDIVLAEGEPDCASLWQHGIPAITGTSGVGKLDKDLLAPLASRTITVFLDNDQAGQTHIEKVVETLEALDCEVRIGFLPEGVKDVSEYFASGKTRDDFQMLVDSAISLPMFIIQKNEINYPIITASEFDKENLPKSKWLITKVVRATGITYWVGQGGVGKTTVLYSAMKSISEGSKWLGIHETVKTKILLLDKENEPIDIQTNLRAMVAVNENILIYRTARDFRFMTDDTSLTEEAEFVRAYCQENGIGAVVMDSMADFYEGDENSSAFAALNSNAWLKTFPNVGLQIIHHENKEIPNLKRPASMRMRGSTHLFNFAQGVISFSKIDENTPERIKVEHTKVRGARKLKPFEIQMEIVGDPNNIGETLITGIKYISEISEAKTAAIKAEEEIMNLLQKSPEKRFTKKEIIASLKGMLGEAVVKDKIVYLQKNNLINRDTSSRAYTYWCKNTDEIQINRLLMDDSQN